MNKRKKPALFKFKPFNLKYSNGGNLIPLTRIKMALFVMVLFVLGKQSLCLYHLLCGQWKRLKMKTLAWPVKQWFVQTKRFQTFEADVAVPWV